MYLLRIGTKPANINLMIDLSRLARPGPRRIAVHVKPAAERSLRSGHPWLFEDSITKQSHEGKPGDQAVVYDRKDRFLAVGLYDPFSPIRVRLLAHNEPQPISPDWFRERLNQSFQVRGSYDDAVTSGFRLVHGENDGFPGLILDKYGRVLVLKLYSTAWVPYLKDLLPNMLELAEANQLVLRLSRKVQDQEEALYGLHDRQQLFGPLLDGPVQFNENGLIFEADLVKGHKTGFYLDQRENRAFLENLLKRDGGIHDLLNLFCYTGGFSIYAARAGTNSTTNVDISLAVLKAAEVNFELNESGRKIARSKKKFVVGDVFAFLEETRRAGRIYDAIVIDPPSFANRNSQVKSALRSYGYLARKGIKLLKEGGILAMFSCSSRVSSDQFFKCVRAEAQYVGRPLQELLRTGHPADHPISFDQGTYLKGIFARVP